MFSDAETENTFQSHRLPSDPVPHGLLERQNCKQSCLRYNLQKPQGALSVAKTLEFGINKHWQEPRGSPVWGGEDAEMWLGSRTRRWQRLGRGTAEWGPGRAELPKCLLPASPCSSAGQRCSGGSLIQANTEAKRKNYLWFLIQLCHDLKNACKYELQHFHKCCNFSR